jgi:hypothetical protein
MKFGLNAFQLIIYLLKLVWVAYKFKRCYEVLKYINLCHEIHLFARNNLAF